MESKDILNLKFYSNDLNKKVTIKQYFQKLLETLWIEGEEFNGKRPFGNSGWEEDLIKCLIKNKLISGKIDEDDYIEDCNNQEVDKFVLNKIIKEIFKNV